MIKRLQEDYSMRISVLLMIVAGVMWVSACSDPAADKTKAVTGEATKVASPAAAAQGQKYLITPQNSKIEFTGSKVTGSENGSFGLLRTDRSCGHSGTKSRQYHNQGRFDQDRFT